MNEVITIGVDLAKNVYQVHGVDAEGGVVYRRQLRRGQMLPFFKKQRPCLVGMEACATSHHWGREIAALGHEVRLMPPRYVKPYVKRNKNDMADAEAICEAVTRPTMRFVEIKTPEQQSVLMLHRTRHLFGGGGLPGLHHPPGQATKPQRAEPGRADRARGTLYVARAGPFGEGTKLLPRPRALSAWSLTAAVLVQVRVRSLPNVHLTALAAFDGSFADASRVKSVPLEVQACVDRLSGFRAGDQDARHWRIFLRNSHTARRQACIIACSMAGLEERCRAGAQPGDGRSPQTSDRP